MDRSRINKTRIIQYFGIIITMLTAAALSACSVNDGAQGFLPSTELVGKGNQLVLTLYDYDGSIKPENLKAGLKIRQQGVSDRPQAKAAEAEEEVGVPVALCDDLEREEEFSRREAMAKEAVQETEDEAEAEDEEILSGDPEDPDAPEAAIDEAEEDGDCADGCLHEEDGEDGLQIEAVSEDAEDPLNSGEGTDEAQAEIEYAAGTVKAQPFPSETVGEKPAETQDVEEVRDETPAVENSADEGMVYGTEWNKAAEVDKDGVLRLYFDIAEDLYPVNLDSLSIYDASVSGDIPVLIAPLQTAAENHKATVELSWSKLLSDMQANAEAQAQEAENQSEAPQVCAKTEDYTLNATINITKISEEPLGIHLFYHTDNNPDIKFYSSYIYNNVYQPSVKTVSVPLTVQTTGAFDYVYIDAVNVFENSSYDSNTWSGSQYVSKFHDTAEIDYSLFTKNAYTRIARFTIASESSLSDITINRTINNRISSSLKFIKFDSTNNINYYSYSVTTKTKEDEVRINKITVGDDYYEVNWEISYVGSNRSFYYRYFIKNTPPDNSGSKLTGTLIISDLPNKPNKLTIGYMTDKNRTLRTKTLNGTYNSSNKKLTVSIDLSDEYVDGNNWFYLKNINLDNNVWSGSLYLYNNFGSTNQSKLTETVSFNDFTKASTTSATPTPTPTPTTAPAPTSTKYQITVSSVYSAPSGSSTLEYKENGAGTAKTVYGSYDGANSKVTYTVNSSAASLSVIKVSVGGRIYDTARTVYSSSPNLTLYHYNFYKNVYLYINNMPSSLSAEVQYTEDGGSAVKTLSTGSYNSSSKKYTFTGIKTFSDYITVKKLTVSQKQPGTFNTKITETSYAFDYNGLTDIKTTYNYKVAISNVPEKPSFAKLTYSFGDSYASLSENVTWSYASNKVTFTLPSEYSSVYISKIEIDNRYCNPYKTVYSSSPSYEALSYDSMYAKSINYTVTVTGVNTAPTSSALTHSGSGSSVSGSYYSSSKTLKFSFTSQNAVKVSKIKIVSGNETRNYTNSIALSYKVTDASVAYANMTKETTNTNPTNTSSGYKIVVTDVDIAPYVHTVVYSKNNSPVNYLEQGTYDKDKRTFTFKFDGANIKLSSITIHNRQRSWPTSWKLSEGTYEISYKQFSILSQVVGLNIKITDNNSVLPVSLSKVKNCQLTYKYWNTQKTCTAVSNKENGKYCLRFSVQIPPEYEKASIKKIIIGNRQYEKTFGMTYGHYSANTRTLDLSSNFKKVKVKYTFQVKNVPSDLSNTLKYNGDGKAYKLTNEGVYNSSNKTMTFTLSSSADTIKVTNIVIGKRKSTCTLKPYLGLTRKFYAVKDLAQTGESRYDYMWFDYKTNMGTKGNKLVTLGCTYCAKAGSGNSLDNNVKLGNGVCRKCKGSGKNTSGNKCLYCNGKKYCYVCSKSGAFTTYLGLGDLY